MTSAERWLLAHPRGHIILTADESGRFTAIRSCIDSATGNEAADAASGWGYGISGAIEDMQQEGGE